MYFLKGDIRLRGKEVEKYFSSNLESQDLKGEAAEKEVRGESLCVLRKRSERGQGSIR